MMFHCIHSVPFRFVSFRFVLSCRVERRLIAHYFNMLYLYLFIFARDNDFNFNTEHFSVHKCELHTYIWIKSSFCTLSELLIAATYLQLIPLLNTFNNAHCSANTVEMCIIYVIWARQITEQVNHRKCVSMNFQRIFNFCTVHTYERDWLNFYQEFVQVKNDQMNLQKLCTLIDSDVFEYFQLLREVFARI